MIMEEDLKSALSVLSITDKSNNCIDKKEYKVFRIDEKFVVAIPVEDEEEFLAKLEGVIIKKEYINNERFLTLTTNSYSDIFLNLATDFVSFFIKKKENKLIPQVWVDSWENLIGNKITEEIVYDVFGELLVWKKLLEKGYQVKLTEKGSIDIESSNALFEVKTTKRKHGESIIINSEFQLEKFDERNIYLEYVKIEPSEEGECINSLLEQLKLFGCDLSSIKSKYKNFSTKYRIQKYRELEIREYLIDESFPKITKESFVGGKLPIGISKITYEVDLTGIKFKKI